MDFSFEGKTGLVTGAGSGIGRELVKKLATLRLNLVALSRSQAKLKSLLEELGEFRSFVTIINVDLSKWNETESKIGDLCKGVDFLINCAGYSHNCPVDEVPEEEFDRIIHVNLKASVNLIRLVAGGMKERRYGAIVNVSSVAGLAALDNHVVYGASKSGLDMVTKVSAKELGPFNIRVNSVNPTVTLTPMAEEHWSDPEKKKQMISKIPLGRFAKTEEVVGPIVFLLSNQASMINGIVLPIDGGFSAT